MIAIVACTNHRFDGAAKLGLLHTQSDCGGSGIGRDARDCDACSHHGAATSGYTAIEVDKYLLWFLLPLSVDMLMTAILAVFLQALSSSKYMGWGLMGLYLVASITLVSIGFEHPLYNFGDVGFVMVSDLNGTDVAGTNRGG